MPSDFRGSRDGFDPGLLTPSLQGDLPTRPIFSSRAGFWVAFFGGVYASAIFSAFNLVRMRRLSRDAWICAAGVLLWTPLLVWLANAVAHPERAPEWLLPIGTATAMRLAGRGCGMLLFAILYLRQRTLYTAQRLTSDESPNPWPLGIASCVAGTLVSYAVVIAGRMS